MTRPQKMKLLDENDEVIKPEATHKEAHNEAKQRNLQLAILNDPETNDAAFKLMTTEQYKTHNVNSQQKNPRVKVFKLNSASSEHDRDIQYGKIEKVLKKGHPAFVTVIARSRSEPEVCSPHNYIWSNSRHYSNINEHLSFISSREIRSCLPFTAIFFLI